jgi:hypothetical protein
MSRIPPFVEMTLRYKSDRTVRHDISRYVIYLLPNICFFFFDKQNMRQRFENARSIKPIRQADTLGQSRGGEHDDLGFPKRSVADICNAIPLLSRDAAELAADLSGPEQYVRLLKAYRLTMDALRFLSHAFLQTHRCRMVVSVYRAVRSPRQ